MDHILLECSISSTGRCVAHRFRNLGGLAFAHGLRQETDPGKSDGNNNNNNNNNNKKKTGKTP